MPTDPGQPVPPIERLVQDARADAGPPRRGRRGEAYTALDNINRWMEATGISNGHLARMVGVSPSVMSQVRHRSYPGDSAGIIEKAEAAIGEWYRRRNAPRGQRFVTTQIAKEIFAVVRITTKHRGIGVVTGPSGIGKTKALQAIVKADYPSAILLEVNAGCATPLHFLRAIIRHERLRPLAGQGFPAPRGGSEDVYSIAEAFNRITERLAGSSRLIALDEADGLLNPTFNIVRQLYDATKCPVVLAGRPPLNAKIRRTIRDEAIGGSLSGRICVDHRLEPRAIEGTDGRWWFSQDEIVAFLEQYKVSFSPDAARWLAALANVAAIEGHREAGALRYAEQVLQLAIAINTGDRITETTLKEANGLLRGTEWASWADQVAASLTPRYSATA